MVEKKNKSKSLITSSVVTIVIVAILLLSGPLANALMVTLSADKTQVRAGELGAAGNITFTTWVNLSSPDAYVPIQRIYLNLSGPLPRSFSFDTSGGAIAGRGYDGELTVSTSGGFNSGNYGFGNGTGYGYNTGSNYGFGYGYGYGYGNGAGSAPLNVSYNVTLNTSYMYDGNYTAVTNVFAAGSSLSQGFASTTSVSFEVLPRIFTAPIPGIVANGSNSSGLITTPIGNFSYTIVAGPNGTSAVNMSITVQANPPANVSYQINASTGGLGAGAIPSLYFNYTIDDPSWYDNISYIHMRMYYNQSTIPSNVDESTLRPARYLSNVTSPGWVKLECGTCPRTLEIVTDSDNHNRSVTLNASGVNTTGDYVWANVTHFSSYGVAGTVTTSGGTSGSGDGGSGGGGGGITSSEPYDNIARSETYTKNLVSNTPVLYTFKLPELGIYELSVTGKESENNIDMKVEALKGRTKITGIAAPPGLVYKNINIWSSSKRIKEGLIRFKVENTWIANNNVASSDLVLIKWDGKEWAKLVTSELKKDSTYAFYEAKTDSFSSFAITALKGAVVPDITPEGTPIAGTPVKPVSTGTPTPVPTKKKTPGFNAIVAVFAIAMIVTLLKNNRNRR